MSCGHLHATSTSSSPQSLLGCHAFFILLFFKQTEQQQQQMQTAAANANSIRADLRDQFASVLWDWLRLPEDDAKECSFHEQPDQA